MDIRTEAKIFGNDGMEVGDKGAGREGFGEGGGSGGVGGHCKVEGGESLGDEVVVGFFTNGASAACFNHSMRCTLFTFIWHALSPTLLNSLIYVLDCSGSTPFMFITCTLSFHMLPTFITCI